MISNIKTGQGFSQPNEAFIPTLDSDSPSEAVRSDPLQQEASDMQAAEFDLLAHHIDREFYLQQTFDEAAHQDPVAHYINSGWQLGLDPHPEFSSAFYLQRSPDVREAGVNPYLHYIQWGRNEGRLPNPALRDSVANSAYSATDVTLMRQHFDHELYTAQDARIQDCHIDPVLHYLSFGWKEDRDPSREFSTRFYLEHNQDVREAGVNPFLHYLKWGKAEGRRGRANAEEQRYHARADTDSEATQLLQAHFDVDHYIAQKPDLEGNDAAPVLHYQSVGWRENLDPTPEFSTAFYRRSHSNIDFTGQDPFSEYLMYGSTHGSIPYPVVPVLSAFDSSAKVLMSKRLIAEHFDSEFYLNSSPDLQSGNVHPLEHYLHFGWRENRDPAPWFSTSYYRANYPRAELYGIDPLTHYVIWGRDRGFKTHPNLPPEVNPVILRKTSCVRDTMLLDAHMEKPGQVAAPLADYDSGTLDVHWVIPNFGIGGGGHMTIFRMIHWLEYFGHRCTIWINTKDGFDPDSRYDDVLKYYQFVKADIRQVSDELYTTQGDALVATSWDTAALVNEAKGFKDRFYFVQDYEPMFYARGSRGVLAEETYGLDLACICASPWLRHMLETNHGRWARDFYLSYDPDFYYAAPSLERKNDIPRIALYSRIGTERRCVELALLALEELARQGVAFHVDIFGVDQPFDNLIFPSTFHGVLSAEELGALYRSCDLGLCFSATNYSLVPQEMMACGLPVIELDVESARHSIAEGAAFFSPPRPEDIAASITHLLDNPEERLALAKRGQEWAASTSWEEAARSVEDALKEKLSEGSWIDTAPATPAILHEEPTKASVIIPTLNGGEMFTELLERIEAQKVQWPFELVIVDSGSTDDTVSQARKLPFTNVIEIDKKQFQHGRTRNLGAARSTGEYILFLTQDALPADSFWLYNFVSTMDRFPEAAGGFGKHFAHRDASAPTKLEMRNHFAGFNQFPLMVSKYTDLPKWNSGDRGWRQVLHYYSDNNSCMRRSAWNEMPYPEISYGEDQLWAQQAMLRGWNKIYCPNAIVQHSHEYDYEETLERAEVEAWFFRKYFGYDMTVPDMEREKAARNAAAERLGVQYGLSREEIEKQKRNGAAQLMGWQMGRQRGEMEAHKVESYDSPRLSAQLDEILKSK